MTRTQRKREPHSTLDELAVELDEANNENEVRHKICAQLGISSQIKMVGSTDGVCKNILFEFKFDKKFCDGLNWNKSAYGTLAQAIYYCRKILNQEYEGIDRIPHTIVICDKNGGFIFPTKSLEWIIGFDPTDDLDCTSNIDCVNYRNNYEFLIGGGFTWSTPPSSQNRVLVQLLMDKDILKNINYLDFNDRAKMQNFFDGVERSSGEFPRIQITQQNFINIFDKWFDTFSADGDSRRDWVDRFIIDLRNQYSLNRTKGTLINAEDTWRVPVDTYEAFWRVYKRPPSARVDEFIVTNKDLLYEVTDQNNNGDFYTPLKLVHLAQAVMFKSISNNKKRVWWDPAAGGGNLFFRFNKSQDVILSTKFESDAAGLKNNPSVQSSLVLQMDFIHEMIEKDFTLSEEWSAVKNIIDKNDELVFFMNPPFDDQAESGGTSASIPETFLEDESVSARSMRALHTRFLYRILCLARSLKKPVWVACFSKTAWIVGPDSETFFKEWSKNFKFHDGLIISSKVFNGTKGEWPCLFSVWSYDPNSVGKNGTPEINIPVYESDYSYSGHKVLQPFNAANVRMSELPKIEKKYFGRKEDYVVVPPLKNEFEVSEIVYEDTMPSHALGYLRVVANDVYNSTQRVQIFSSMCGPSNHNGISIIPENFEDALAVYGIRKSVRRNWLNDKDEFYFPRTPSEPHMNLKRMAAIYALVDGAYASSVENLKYKKKKFSFRNHLSLPSRLELRGWGADDVPETESYANFWLRQKQSQLGILELRAIRHTKSLIKLTFNKGTRGKADVKRQLWRGDAGLRQIINGLIEFEGARISEDLKKAYVEYSKSKELLRKEIERLVYELSVLLPFNAVTDEEIIPVSDIAKALRRAKTITGDISKAGKKKKRSQ